MPKLKFQYVRQASPETLLEFLVRRFRYHNAEQWEQRVHEGYVTVNGRTTVSSRLLETRDKILYDRPPGPEPDVDDTYRVLYEDDDLLAVSKSGNMPTSPSGKYWRNCLVHILKDRHSYPSLHAVHRLDRETSGINLFAKHRDAARALGQDFQEGRVEKGYSAVLRGHVLAKRIYISAPLWGAPGAAVRIRQEVHPAGRPASTHFNVLALLPGATLAEVRPVTGRTHQIRVHAAHLGHPVWGDKLYGAGEDAFIAWVGSGERNSWDRHLLHADRLSVTHPQSGRRLDLRDPPELLLDLFHRLRPPLEGSPC